MIKNTEIFNELSGYLSIRIHSCQEAKHGPQWIENKTHSHYDLWLVRSGTLSVKVGGHTYRASQGDAIFFYPHIPYTASTEDAGCRFIYIVFDFGISNHQRILNDFDLSGIVPRTTIEKEMGFIVEAYDQERADSSKSSMRMKGFLTILLARIIELHGQGVYSGTMNAGYEQYDRTRSLSDLQPVFQYIHDHLHKPIQMSELAAIACLSEKYFITFFKRALGLTPGQYINQLKMNRARDYLQERKYTVKQIAHMLGYPDSPTFSKAFKKYYRIAPSQFV